MKLLAIDIGASGGKAVLGDLAGGKLTTREVRRFANGFVELRGRKHWDIARLFEEAKECLRSAGPEVTGAGIDTWAVDYGYIGPDGDLLGLPFAYRDSRAETCMEYVHERISPQKLYSLTGIPAQTINTIYQVADDLRNRPWLVEHARKLLMIPELISHFLTGHAAAEYTNASTTSLMDAKKRTWSGEVLDAIGFPKEKLCDIVQPGEKRAALDETIARETGSKAELVFSACHDTGSAVAAVPALEDDWVFISSGTWSLAGMELDQPVLTEEARTSGFTNEGGAGGKIRFLKNICGMWLIQELRRLWALDGRDLDYPTICSEAEKAPAFVSLVNPDDPSFMAPENMREAVSSFCRSTKQPVPDGVGPVARCVFESLALTYRRVVRQLSEVTGHDVRRIHIVGGGSQNELLCRMAADACNVPILAGPVEASSIGNLLVQAMSWGAVGSIAEGRRIVANSFPLVEYSPKEPERWEAAAERFDALVGGS